MPWLFLRFSSAFSLRIYYVEFDIGSFYLKAAPLRTKSMVYDVMMGLNFETHDLMTWKYIYELFKNVYEVYSQDDL